MLIDVLLLRKYLKVDGVRIRRLLEQAGLEGCTATPLTEAEVTRVLTVFYSIRGEGILRRNGRLHNLDGGSETFARDHSSHRGGRGDP
ncbi:MAG: hypothetical protein V3U34_00680 [candidate division NC10 bacterium]